MSQLVMRAVSDTSPPLYAEAQFVHLDALEQLGKAITEEKGAGPDELRRSFWAGPETRTLKMGIGAAGIEIGEKDPPRKLSGLV